jgi:hypothetical protein
MITVTSCWCYAHPELAASMMAISEAGVVGLRRADGRGNRLFGY